MSRVRPLLFLLRVFPFVCAAAACPGCAGVSGLSDQGASRPPLSASEQGIVNGQIERALAERRFADAWNQAVEAGAERGRLQQIALAALVADHGDAEDMFGELRGKWGALTPDAKGAVESEIRSRLTAGRWAEAVDAALTTADDAPTFARAFRIYEQAPARKAADLLAAIQDARAAAAAPK